MSETEKTGEDVEQQRIERDILRQKPVQRWTDREKEAGREMTTTLGVSLYNMRRLDDLCGSKSQSWDEILGDALDILEASSPQMTNGDGQDVSQNGDHRQNGDSRSPDEQT